jgi:hypothetical protein
LIPPLERFRLALNGRNVASLRSAYPSIPATQERNWAGLFAAADTLRATFRYGKPVVQGDRADLDVTIQTMTKTRSSPAASRSVTLWHAALIRRDGRWEIAAMDPR